MVGGKKCVLQQDPQTGQILAYPVKDPGKPHRKRGRPRRKISTEDVKDANLVTESVTTPEPSEEERVKGLHEVITGEGSLVRRSARKRRKAKILKDFETGNLRQELGSDVEDSGQLESSELAQYRKRRKGGPGRPRKVLCEPSLSALDALEMIAKRPRGRPRKQTDDKEPTQAFLVQTADGQTLMMQVPLSSIPSGVSLQDVAQTIANRLNVGLTQSNNTASEGVQSDTKDEIPNHILDGNNTVLPEPVVQDHAIGSTTNLPNADGLIKDRLSSDESSSSSNIISKIEKVIVFSTHHAGGVNEVTLRSDKSNSFLPENILKEHFPSIPTSCPENSVPAITIPTSNSSPTTIHSGLPIPDQKEDILVNNLTPAHFSKNFLMDRDFFKDKVNIHLLLQNVESAATEEVVSGENDENSGLKELTVESSPSFPTIPSQSTSKDSTIEFSDVIIPPIIGKNVENQQCSYQAATSFDAIISSIEHDHDFLIQVKETPVSESLGSTNCDIDSGSIPESDINTKMPIPRISIQDCDIDTKIQIPNISPLNDISSILKGSTISEASTSTAMLQQSPATTVVPVSIGENKKDKPKVCKICHKTFDTDEELISHFKSYHPKCICNECNYLAEHAYVIRRHALRHSNTDSVCRICNKQYKDPYILKMHIKMVHLPAETIYTCEECQKKFTRKAHLKRHLRIHEPDRPYKCPLCDYRGCERSDITKHVLVHETPKHKCELCGKTFRHSKNKELHLKRHYKQRDYKCGLCDFYGYTFTDIRKHIERRHAGSAAWNTDGDQTCSDCGLTFSSQAVLDAHKNSGTCVPNQELQNQDILITDDGNKDAVLLEEISLDILEDHSVICEAARLDSDAKLETIVLNPTDEMLNASQTEELSDLLVTENISLLPIDKDNKFITLVDASGKKYSYVTKDSSDYIDNILEAVSSKEAVEYLNNIETEA